jgi:dephospho-CoA kinase
MRVKPFVVGLTGSIGCGKSTVLQTLTGLGALGIDADQVAHAVMLPGAPAYAGVMAEFGTAVLAPDGQIDRRRLGQRVFGDLNALARLESLVHPAVAESIRAQVNATDAPLVVIEAIKLLEAGLSRGLCDQVWVVICPPDQQDARLAAARGMTAAEVASRRAAQMPQDQMVAQAQRVIDAGGTLAGTAVQALAAWGELDLPLPPVTVRPAVEDDAPGIAEVLNAVIREGGLTVLDHICSAEEERAFLRGLPPRSRLTVAGLGPVIAGFQVLEPYVTYTHALEHVAQLGTYVLGTVRGRGIGRALANETLAYARDAGFRKIVINVRADNLGAQNYYAGLGFRPCGRLAQQAWVDGHYVDELLYEHFLAEGPSKNLTS